jgi:hypothetical protein
MTNESYNGLCLTSKVDTSFPAQEETGSTERLEVQSK